MQLKQNAVQNYIRAAFFYFASDKKYMQKEREYAIIVYIVAYNIKIFTYL